MHPPAYGIDEDVAFLAFDLLAPSKDPSGCRIEFPHRTVSVRPFRGISHTGYGGCVPACHPSSRGPVAMHRAAGGRLTGEWPATGSQRKAAYIRPLTTSAHVDGTLPPPRLAGEFATRSTPIPHRKDHLDSASGCGSRCSRSSTSAAPPQDRTAAIKSQPIHTIQHVSGQAFREKVGRSWWIRLSCIFQKRPTTNHSLGDLCGSSGCEGNSFSMDQARGHRY